jgi:uncharacterized protein YybS (DUF2232 family)
MKEQHNQWIKDLVIYGALFMVLLVVASILPVATLFIVALMPVPLTIFTYKYGYKRGLLMSGIVLVSTLLFAFTLFLISLPLAGLSIIVGTLVGEAMRKQKHPYETLAQGTLGYMVGFILLVFVIENVMGVSLMTEYRVIIQESLMQSEQLMQGTGIEVTGEMLNTIEQQMLIVLDLLPAILLIGSFIFALILQWISYKLVNNIQKVSFRFPPFYRLQLPKATIWLFLVVMVIDFIDFGPDAFMTIVLMNVLLIFGLLFSIQGLSFMFYYLQYKKQSKVLGIVLFVIGLVILPVGLYVTRILGIMDIGFMLRKRLK